MKFLRSGGVKDERLDRDSDLIYSTNTPFSEIKPVHPALTSFAVQKVKEKVVREAKEAVLPLSSLHATTSDRSTRKANWVDIGATTIPDVANVLTPSSNLQMPSICTSCGWNGR